MNADLEAIADAMDKSTGEGRDREHAVELCDAYVEAHPELFAGLDKIDLDILVRQLESHREKGEHEKQWNIEAWLLHRYPPQNIGGTYTVSVRVPNN